MLPSEDARRWRWLASRRIILLATLLGVVLASPSLVSGWQTEDYEARSLARAPITTLLRPFRPVEDPTFQNYAGKDEGVLPWLTVPAWRIALWRPLTRATHYLDYRLWPESAAAMHAQSLAWFALLLAAAGWFFRRIDGAGRAAGLAAVLYAVDSGHGPALGWLSNRNAIVASAFALLSLGLHDRWRREGWLLGALAAPLCLVLGLMSSELALGAMGYLIAYAVVIDRARWQRRALSLLPATAVVAAWALVTRQLGYGAYGSGAYIDPLASPLAFVRALPLRLLELGFGVLGVAPLDLKPFLDMRWPLVLVAGGLVFLSFAVVLLGERLRSDRGGRFWALGTALALLPAAATFPGDRLLVLGSVGGAALIARFVMAIGRAPWPRAARALGGIWLLTHLWLSALLLPVRSLGFMLLDRTIDRMSDQAFACAGARVERVVIVNAPDLYTGASFVARRRFLGRPSTPNALVMHGGIDPVRVRRLDAFTLSVRPALGFLAMPFNRVYRDDGHPMRSGEGLQLTGVQAIVAAVDAHGRPTEVRFRFARPLEDPRYCFVAWNGRSYSRLPLPSAGGTVLVPAVHLRF